MPKRKRNNFSGFTLIELLIVIAILGVLASFALISFRGAQAKARDAERKSDLGQYATTLADYAGKNDGYYPEHYIPGGEGIWMETVCANDLDLPNCPENPWDPSQGSSSGTRKHYLYGSDATGSKYVLMVSTETKIDGTLTWFIICSTGKRGLVKLSDFGPQGMSIGFCPTSVTWY